MLRQLTHVNFKWRELIKMINDTIFTCFLGDIYVWILTTILYPLAEAYFGPSQASKMDLFVRIVKGFKLTMLTNFEKNSIVHIRRDP